MLSLRPEEIIMFASIPDSLAITSSFSVPEFKCFQRQYGHLKISSRSHKGIKPIDIDKIVGTVGRCKQNNGFQKLVKTNRYQNIRLAIKNQEHMPAIEVYKVEDEYYIVDGHHRVIASKELNRKFIDAKVTAYEFGEPKEEKYHGCLKSDSRVCQENLEEELSAIEKIGFKIKRLNSKLPYRQIIIAWYDTELLPYFKEENLKKLTGRKETKKERNKTDSSKGDKK